MRTSRIFPRFPCLTVSDAAKSAKEVSHDPPSAFIISVLRRLLHRPRLSHLCAQVLWRNRPDQHADRSDQRSPGVHRTLRPAAVGRYFRPEREEEACHRRRRDSCRCLFLRGGGAARAVSPPAHRAHARERPHAACRACRQRDCAGIYKGAPKALRPHPPDRHRRLSAGYPAHRHDPSGEPARPVRRLRRGAHYKRCRSDAASPGQGAPTRQDARADDCAPWRPAHPLDARSRVPRTGDGAVLPLLLLQVSG